MGNCFSKPESPLHINARTLDEDPQGYIYVGHLPFNVIPIVPAPDREDDDAIFDFFVMNWKPGIIQS